MTKKKNQLTIHCIQAGGGVYLVDQGRPGQRAMGIPRGGAADRRAANRLREILELPPEAILLECSLVGGQWLLSGRGQLAIGGADMPWKLNGRPLEAYTTIDLDGDYLLDGGQANCGCRSYIALRGEWQVPRVLGSVSPGVPGIQSIRKGWEAQLISWEELAYTSDFDPYQHCPRFPLQFAVLPGPEWSLLPTSVQANILQAAWVVQANSDRQGLRLASAELASSWPQASLPQASSLSNMISSAVLPGTIQLTPSGLILLLCDAQTVGGFPRVLLLAQEVAVDVAGQLKQGDALQLIAK